MVESQATRSESQTINQASKVALATPVSNFCQMSNIWNLAQFVDNEDLWVYVFLLFDWLDEVK
jgi:hypothetical protein